MGGILRGVSEAVAIGSFLFMIVVGLALMA